MFTSKAQELETIQGNIKDTLGQPISGARINIRSDLDSSIVYCDTIGQFLAKIRIKNLVKITVNSLGYSAKDSTFKLQRFKTSDHIVIFLKIAVKELSEVLVKKAPRSIKVKGDTIEYNVAYYSVNKEQKLRGLLMQLAGVELERNGDVKFEGRLLSKLKVNGKDFFSGNLRDFIEKLPSDIIDKVQIIDDYGDDASFSGIKNGPYTKSINLQIKPGMSYGIFGGIAASASTLKAYSTSLSGNYWNNQYQVSAIAQIQTIGNNIGVMPRSELGFTYKDVLKKDVSFAINYNYSRERIREKESSLNITDNALGELSTSTEKSTNVHSEKHTLGVQLNINSKRNYLSFSPKLLFNNSNALIESSSLQKGIINQLFYSNRLNNINSPIVEAAVSFGHKFKKSGRLLSLMASVKSNDNNINQTMSDRIDNKELNDSISVSNRNVYNKKRLNTVNFSINYSEPVTRYLGFNVSYSYNSNNERNINKVWVIDSFKRYKQIDSLSYQNTFTSTSQSVTINGHLNIKKFSTNIGLAILPSIVQQNYYGARNNSQINTINYSPVANITYSPNVYEIWKLNYSGYTAFPTNEQLQPNRDITNLQNIIVGNPNLKPSFFNQFNLNYRHTIGNKGSLSTELEYSFVTNDIVLNNILVKTDSNNFKQETHFANVNGTNKFLWNYYLSAVIFTFSEKSVSINLNGGLNFNKNAFYTNGLKAYNQSVYFNQSISTAITFKNIYINFSSSYSYAKNAILLQSGNTNDLQNLQLSLNYSYDVTGSLNIASSVDKSITKGYSKINGGDPFNLNLSLHQQIFNHKITCGVSVSNILNKANSISRTVMGNAIIDRYNQVAGRAFLFDIILQLSKFSGH